MAHALWLKVPTLLCREVPGQSEAEEAGEGAAEPHAVCTVDTQRC